MPRQVTSDMLAALQAPGIQPIIYAEMWFATATIRVWSGIGTTAWNGQTYIGLGTLLSIGVVEDAATVEARGITINLSGLDASLLPECIGDFQLGLPCKVWLVLASIPWPPVAVWVGRMDRPTIEVGGDTATIEIACENRLIDMNIPSDRRLTLQDSQMDFPGDLGLMFQASIQEVTLSWGSQANSTTNI